MDKLDIELRKHKFILIVGDHYNPLGVLRSLGEKGLNPIVILISDKPCLITHSKYVTVLHKVNSKEEAYDVLLENYGNEVEKPFLFFSDDRVVSFMDIRYDLLKNKFIMYNAGEQGRIVWLQNKDNITNLGAEAGLFCPKKEVVDKGVLPKTLNYPIITKVLASTMGAWKDDVYICKDEHELIEAYKKIKSPKLCLQEYIQKKGEFCMEGFSINDGKEVFMPYMADYIRYYNNSYGHYMDMIPFKDDSLKLKIEQLFRLTRFNGIFEIEFMRGPKDEIYFLEINFRASTWNYAPTVGGCNMPYLWAKGMLTGDILYDEMQLRDKPFKAIVDYEDFFSNAKRVGYLRWIREYRNSECKYYYNSKDPRPFYAFIKKRICNKLKSLLKI